MGVSVECVGEALRRDARSGVETEAALEIERVRPPIPRQRVAVDDLPDGARPCGFRRVGVVEELRAGGVQELPGPWLVGERGVDGVHVRGHAHAERAALRRAGGGRRERGRGEQRRPGGEHGERERDPPRHHLLHAAAMSKP